MPKIQRKNRSFQTVAFVVIVCAMVSLQFRVKTVHKAHGKRVVRPQVVQASLAPTLVVPELNKESEISIPPSTLRGTTRVRAHSWPRRTVRSPVVRRHASRRKDKASKIAKATLFPNRARHYTRLASVKTNPLLDALVVTRIEEPSLSEDFSWNPYLSPLAWTTANPAEPEIAREDGVERMETVLRPANLESLKIALNEYSKENFETVAAPEALPEIPNRTESRSLFSSENPTPMASTLPESSSVLATILPEAERLAIEAAPEGELLGEADLETPAPTAAPAPEPTLVRPTPDLSPMLGSMATPSLSPSTSNVVTQFHALDRKLNSLSTAQVTNQPVTDPSPESKEPKTGKRKSGKSRMLTAMNPADADRVFGKLTFDESFSRWLESHKGHIELYLNRVGSRDPQDTIFIDYQFPERDFEFDGKLLQGNYRLVAGVYTPDSGVALAQVVYERPLSLANHREMIVFHLRKSTFDKSLLHSRTGVSDVVVTGTVFEAASGDPREPKPLEGTDVRIFNFPEIGRVVSDTEGNFQIDHVPAQSQFLLHVSRPGYYDTTVTVPTSGSNVHVPIYLVSKDKVETITKFFTKRDQNPGKSIVLGRVFDPATRGPRAGTELALSGRPGKAVYFNALPDVTLDQTTDNGLFGFFNVEPTVRALSLGDTPVGALLNVAPAEAHYIEFGRGGARTLKGKLVDPFKGGRVAGKVRVVGSSVEMETDEAGQFAIDNITLAPGIITLEVEARGYPLTWHSVSWNPKSTQKVQTLYLVDGDLISESQVGVAKIAPVPHQGSVIGGAEARLFSKAGQCVSVSLANGRGIAVDSSHGPFPLSIRKEALTGSGLCLTAQDPGFAFYNLPPGQYLLRWQDETGKPLRSRVFFVGVDRSSILVN